MAFLKRLNEAGVKNIEMEATALAAITKASGIRSGNVCVTIVNRLEGDQVRQHHETKPSSMQYFCSKTHVTFSGDIHERGINPIRSPPPATGGVIHKEGARK